jgi:hypothetical protein
MRNYFNSLQVNLKKKGKKISKFKKTQLMFNNKLLKITNIKIIKIFIQLKYRPKDSRHYTINRDKKKINRFLMTTNIRINRKSNNLNLRITGITNLGKLLKIHKFKNLILKRMIYIQTHPNTNLHM